MIFKTSLVLAAFVACSLSQGSNGPTTTPVPILKQINRQNDDGSYSFGYEAADGSFKIETKYPNGDVAGKYGYVDADGKVREISYGASSKRGFEPQGTDIQVPPPTLNEATSNALTDGQEDDGQYREDPRIYEDPKYNTKSSGRPGKQQSFTQFQQPAQSQPTFRSNPTFSQQTSFQPQNSYNQQQSSFSQPQNSFSQQYQPSNVFNQAPQQFPQEQYRPQSQVFHQQPQFSYQAYTPQNNQYQAQNYQNQNYNPYLGHPAQNIDPYTGSYTINFTG